MIAAHLCAQVFVFHMSTCMCQSAPQSSLWWRSSQSSDPSASSQSWRSRCVHRHSAPKTSTNASQDFFNELNLLFFSNLCVDQCGHFTKLVLILRFAFNWNFFFYLKNIVQNMQWLMQRLKANSPKEFRSMVAMLFLTDRLLSRAARQFRLTSNNMHLYELLNWPVFVQLQACTAALGHLAKEVAKKNFTPSVYFCLNTFMLKTVERSKAHVHSRGSFCHRVGAPATCRQTGRGWSGQAAGERPRSSSCRPPGRRTAAPRHWRIPSR